MKKEVLRNKLLTGDALIDFYKEMNALTKIPSHKLLQLSKEMEWSNYGRNVDNELNWKKFADLSVPHIKNILIFCGHLDGLRKAVLLTVMLDKLTKKDVPIKFRPSKEAKKG